MIQSNIQKTGIQTLLPHIRVSFKGKSIKYHYSLKSKFIFITLLTNVICGINFSILIISNKIGFLVTVSIFPRYLPVVLDLCHLFVAFPIVN